MATYTPILNAETAPLAPVTSPLITRLRDNPVAAFEGAAGAPRLDEAARGGSQFGDTVLFQALGRNVTYSHNGTGADSNWTEVPHSFFRITTPCDLRVTGDVVSATSLTAAQLRILKNGIELAASMALGRLSVDVSCLDGDVVWFEVRAGSGAGQGTATESITIENVCYRTGAVRSCGGC